MDARSADGILSHYPHASALQRWHMRGRLHLCPYDALLKHLTGAGTLLDIGCGFGHLYWYLAERGPHLRYYGTDIDERKIELAEGTVGTRGGSVTKGSAGADGVAEDAPDRLSCVFRHGDVMTMGDLPDAFGNIVLLDVIYLMPWDLQARLLEWAMARLAPGPDSALVIKTMAEAKGFSGFRAVAEEWIMVSLLRRTRSSGALNGIRPFEAYVEFAARHGFRCEIENLPTFNPSSIFRIHR